MRTAKIHNATYAPIADLTTYTALPTRSLHQIDPFLFLNHHGHQQYTPNNSGLPFGPHPHRGMETVTFILEGDIMHKDSSGHESVIEAGGIQWMTAGSGLIHAEVSSEKFKLEGGSLEILQLWINLPSQLKMTPPTYVGLQKASIPTRTVDNGKVIINVVSGEWEKQNGPFESLTNVSLATIYFKPGAHYSIEIPSDDSILFYVVRGNLMVNETKVVFHQLVHFDNDSGVLNIKAETDAVLLIGYAKPLNEPVVAQGPFVMNTEDEITQAYQDYREGKFGKWQHAY
jgi:redox-sensitive bicupin YhaK (pirin superfamily)